MIWSELRPLNRTDPEDDDSASLEALTKALRRILLAGVVDR
jgi:hypothetical protein